MKAGDVVKKGQVLLTFEGTDNSDNLKTQQSSLDAQQLDLADRHRAGLTAPAR